MMAQELLLAPPDAAAPLLLFAVTAAAFLAAGLAPLAVVHVLSGRAVLAAELGAAEGVLGPLWRVAGAACAAVAVIAAVHAATLGASQRGAVVAAGALRAAGAAFLAGAVAAGLCAASAKEAVGSLFI